jgi:hypothetical protein
MSVIGDVCKRRAVGQAKRVAGHAERGSVWQPNRGWRTNWGVLRRARIPAEDITPEHVSEAIQYRTFDRTLWV